LLHEVRLTIKKVQRRLELIEPLVYRRYQVLPPFRCLLLPDASQLDPTNIGPAGDDSAWPIIQPNTYWGGWLTDYVLRTQFQVPDGWDPDAAVALYLPLGVAGDFSHPESLAYIDGEHYASCDRHHQEISLPAEWRDRRSHLLALHGWTGRGGATKGEPGTQLFMRTCALVEIDQATRDFLATARVAAGIVQQLDENEPARAYLLNALDEAFKLLDTREPVGDGFYASVPPAHAALHRGIARAGNPMETQIVATGHAHIDVAWLWTLAQTRRKAARTFHTVTRLMEQFPDFHFTQSQPQLYEFIRQDFPDLFEKIGQRVAEGRWEAIGGMWVEADCNLTGPESLARQFLLGRSFFREHFGPQAESPVLWLPDVFGYAWNLPQLMKEAGLDYFFTIKIGWNKYNRLPYDSFWWQGLDGTRVLTHFSTTPEGGSIFWGGNSWASTYNAGATPGEAIGTWRKFQQKELHQELLMAYGQGDGGGGPTREMLENIREMAAFPATPRMRQGSAGDFFRKLEANEGDKLPVWNGELYLELHRGTYTTQSRNKQANRKSEFLLHDAEFLATQAALLNPGYHYPLQALQHAWQLVCLNQFHDIIPGSSITPVYTESLAQYAEVHAAALSVRESALAAIGSQAGGDLLAANPTSFARRDLAFWSGYLEAGQHLERADGTPVATQSAAEGTWLALGEIAPFTVEALRFAGRAGAPSPLQSAALFASAELLENDYLRVELNAAGDITRILDKVNRREVLPDGALAGQFQAFEDRPVDWDAWDIDIFYDDKLWTSEPATSIRVVESGPLRATLEVRRRILHSDYVQRISLACNSRQLDFVTDIEWREQHILLKAAFPIDVLSPVATYEIQWGNVQRPTHRNTSWDWARFESCAQKWVDLGEGGYGASLLNDCKYGHDIRDNVMRISLLRSPTVPDPEADQGEHRFAYSLLPHAGSWDEATIAAAYALNDPIIIAEGQRGRAEKALAPLLTVDRPNIVIETIKQAEDGDGIIVRLYESQRQRGPVTLTTGFQLDSAWRANLLEENQTPLSVTGRQVSLFVKPYQIVTLRLAPAR